MCEAYSASPAHVSTAVIIIIIITISSSSSQCLESKGKVAISLRGLKWTRVIQDQSKSQLIQAKLIAAETPGSKAGKWTDSAGDRHGGSRSEPVGKDTVSQGHRGLH